MAQACIAPYRRNRRGEFWTAPWATPLFKSLFDEWGDSSQSFGIPVDVETNDDELILYASVPGVSQDKLDVTVEDGQVTIKASNAEEVDPESRNFLRRERAVGEFSRTLRLPRDLDFRKAESSYKDGVLRIVFPRSAESKPHRIQIDR